MSFITYLLFRLATFPLTYLSYANIDFLGKILGLVIFYTYPRYRKRALSNLALATSLHLSPKEILWTAKASLQNLAIVFLQYPKLYREKKISRIACCKNPEKVNEILKTGKGVIFFCGHQANWEIFFLEGTSRMKGVAIGRPIKNRLLYRFVIKLREKFGGKIVTPKEGVKEGLRALKKDSFFGIVGDQGMPDSGFSCPFLGRKAWSSPLPAILSIRTGCPVVVATNRRINHGYEITYSDPIWPSKDETPEALMLTILKKFEESIEQKPEEWLWIHNRWKQDLPGHLPTSLRFDSVAIILSTKESPQEIFSLFHRLYPHSFLTFFVPQEYKEQAPKEDEVIAYTNWKEVLIPDFRIKMVYDFIGEPQIEKHFQALSAQKVWALPTVSALNSLLQGFP